MSLSYTKLVGRDASFQLIRTNPKLTSNVKLTVDSNDAVWLNAIPADPELAKDQYQKVAVDVAKSHEFNIFKFYNNGKTPSKISYRIGTTITQTVAAKDLKNQFDFDYYTSGAKYLESKQYPEKFSYFAPLYINQILPDTFVIFKVKGPSNFTAGEQLTSTLTRKEQILKFFRSFQLVKAVDMNPETKIGKYLEAIIENPMRPASPIGINFNSAANSYSYYRGLSIKSGTYVDLPVNTNSVLTRGLPLLTKERFIVSGFEANSIIHPNIINMEFLFNDDTAEDFELNRYFGFYCNRIELAEFDIDLDSMFNNPNDNDQALEVRRDITDDIVIPVTNEMGVKLRGKNLTADITDLKKSLMDDKSIFFSYLETKSDIHLVKSNTWNEENQSVDFRIDDSYLNLGTLFGPGELFSQERATVSNLDTRSTLCAKIIGKPESSASIKLYHATGSVLDLDGRFDTIYFIDSTTASSGSFVFNAPGVWSVDYTQAGQPVIYVSSDGTSQDIATALASAINDLDNTDIQAVVYSNYVYIQHKPTGEAFGSLKASDTSSYITLIGTKIGDFVYADGGTLYPHPIINAETQSETNTPLLKIAENIDQLLVKTEKNWSRIKRVSRVTDGIFPGQSESSLVLATTNYLSKGTLILQDDEQPYVAHGNIEIRKIAKNKVGILSIFEIKDFDFDLYSTNYSRFETLDLFKDFYEPTGIPTLSFREHTYQVVGKGQIEVNGVKYREGEYVWQDLEEKVAYSLIEGDCALIKSPYSPNSFIALGSATNVIDSPISEGDLAIVSTEDNELKNYTGQFSLRTPAVDIDYKNTAKYTAIAEYRDKFIQGVVSSEYLINLEHHAIEFAIDNKLTPYINKWGLRDSIDTRSNPYRLNTDLIFGKDNFGPSHVETFPSAEKLTHEWFYMEADFGFTTDPKLLSRNFNYFETPFEVDQFKTDATYFDQYFQYVPTIDGEQIERVQLRYSDLYRDPYSRQFETVFKGVKYRFFELDQIRMQIDGSVQDSILQNTDRFTDYRFSAILKIVPDQYDDNLPPVKYEIIENTNAKAIVVVVYVRLAGSTEIPQSAKVTINGEPTYLLKADLFEVGTSQTSFVYEDVFGDYRIDFNDNNVSNLTYAFLYYAKNKKYNTGDRSFSTIRLSKNVDVSFAGFESLTNSSSANGIDIPLNENYRSSLVGQISIVPDAYSPLVYKGLTGKRFIITSDPTSALTSTTSILGVIENTVTFDSPTMYLNEIQITANQLDDVVSVPLPTGSPQLWTESYRLYQINGGKDYYERVFQYFSFANFKYLLEDVEDSISWSSYTNGQLESIRRFTIRAQDANSVNLTSTIQNQAVQVTYNSKTVTGGYTYAENALQNPFEIHRYSGEYDAIFKPVSAFYQKTKIGQYEIFGANCTIHINIPDAFILPELHHVKYSPKQILELENSPNYIAEYPIIDETPIGTSSFDVLSSSWDKDYHFEYSNKSTRSKIFGTRRIHEDYSFVSKLINVPETLFMEEYTISQVSQSQYRGTVFASILNWADYKSFARFKFDVATMFAKNFSNAGLLTEFEKFFVDNSQTVIDRNEELFGQISLSQFTEEYARRNLLKLYKVDEIQVWTKTDKTIPNGQIVFEQKNLDQLVNEGYSIAKNVQINNQNSSFLEGSIDKPINSGVRVSFRIKIKFI